jgi:hypothetical protein
LSKSPGQFNRKERESLYRKVRGRSDRQSRCLRELSLSSEVSEVTMT